MTKIQELYEQELEKELLDVMKLELDFDITALTSKIDNYGEKFLTDQSKRIDAKKKFIEDEFLKISKGKSLDEKYASLYPELDKHIIKRLTEEYKLYLFHNNEIIEHSCYNTTDDIRFEYVKLRIKKYFIVKRILEESLHDPLAFGISN